jgi:propanol-preferring alcohol dehydrogenase
MARRAVINGAGEPLRFEDFPIPDPPAGSARVRIEYAGVCHTDLHLRTDETSLGSGRFHRLRDIIGEEKFNTMVMGHEIAGYVDELGPGKSSLGFQKGDKVAVFPWLGCQQCLTCTSGESNLCDKDPILLYDIGCSPDFPGGYQTHMIVDQRHLVKVPDSVPLDIASMLSCSGGTSYSAVQKLKEAVAFGAKTNENGKARVMVIGAGGLGLWAVQLAKVMYPDKVHVVAIDIDQEKLDLARKFGADEGVIWNRAATEEENAAAVTKSGKVNGGIDYIGSGVTSATGFKCLVRNGTLVMVGLHGGALTVPTAEVVLQQKAVRGNIVFNMTQFQDLVSLVAEKGITYPSITYYTLDQVNEALDLLEKGKINGRAIIKHQ